MNDGRSGRARIATEHSPDRAGSPCSCRCCVAAVRDDHPSSTVRLADGGVAIQALQNSTMSPCRRTRRRSSQCQPQRGAPRHPACTRTAHPGDAMGWVRLVQARGVFRSTTPFCTPKQVRARPGLDELTSARGSLEASVTMFADTCAPAYSAAKPKNSLWSRVALLFTRSRAPVSFA